MKHSVTVSVNVPDSFAVDQVRGMFDLKKHTIATETFDVELPDNDEDWQLGVIVGPSGSGKTTVARHAYGKNFIEGFRWTKTKAVVDHFPKTPMKDVTMTLTSVGFSSPPSWVKPHHVLSGGERFRCDLARALLMPGNLVAFDEFTSVVDRTVAKIGSAAIAKSLRKGRFNKKFVAVTCHYDVLEWLEPDWVLDMASCQLARGSLYQRPKIELTVAPVHYSCWNIFRRHHYLNHEISRAAKCFVAFWGDEPAAFSSWLPRITRGRIKNDMREHRTVVLPDFQGVGIGNRMSELCASIWPAVGGRAFSTTSHPAMLHYRDKSPNWKTVRFGMVSPTGESGLLYDGGVTHNSIGRVTGGFQYVGKKLDKGLAESLIDGTSRVRPIGSNVDAVLSAISKQASSKRAIAARSGIPVSKVATIVQQLERSGHVSRVHVGNRVAYELAKTCSR